jgi:hypothetical protein
LFRRPKLTLSCSAKGKEGTNCSVGIAKSYWLNGEGSIPGRVKIFFSSPQRPDLLWGPLRLLSNGRRELSPRGKAAGA